MHPIITLTMNPAVDKSAESPRIAVDKKLRCTNVRRDPGGGGINVTRAIAKLGGTSTAVYVRGGVEGQLLRDLLAREHLNESAIEIEGSVRESLTVVERDSGDQYRFGMPGPELSSDDVGAVKERLRSLIEKGAYLVASGSLPPGVEDRFYAEVAQIAAQAGAHCLVDTSGAALRAAVEHGGLALIKPNLRELAELVGEERIEQPDVRAAATALIEEGKAERVVVSLGAGGAYLVTRDGTAKFGSPSVPVDSRIGAGDSMLAGIVLSLARGESASEAVRRGIAAGAAAVMTPGTELCRRDDAERIYREVQRAGA